MLVDDHPIVRAGLKSIVDAQSDMNVVAESRTGEEAVLLCIRICPDVVLMDLKLPGMSGAEAIGKIHGRQQQIKFLVLTTYEGDEDIYQSLNSGASGYLIKGMDYEVLLDGIRRVHHGRNFIPDQISRIVDERSPEELSPREREVLGLLAQGASNRAIAEALGITEGTVKCHVANVLSYFGVEDRTKAVVAAMRRGFVHLP
jgi:DNA-binding NarL/FixJ family response regulator